ncbi:MAG: hypothetical protein JRE19_19280, partial [Deltaproteobacteria bacterium]|nr:hypothetical protein [Deltaproteobacteria bacterium]
LIATVSSCTQRDLNALNPCTINGVVQNVPVNPQRALDLLIVIDDSASMRDEQAKLAEQVPRLVNLLLTGGAADPSAVGEFPAIESLHVGIITPDLGHSTVPAHPYTAGSAPDADFNPTSVCMANNGNGKAGFMQVTGFQGEPRVMCNAITPPEGTLYLNRPEPGFDDADLISDVTCITGQGADEDPNVDPPRDKDAWGCGFEQQLESILASDRNTANFGFSRDGALLAVILITDEDDCSTTDPRVFDIEARDSNPYKGPLNGTDQLQFNLRCWEHRDALRNVQEYVSGIAALKSDPSQVVFAAITGIPEDGALDRANFNTDEDRYAAILDHSAMVEIPNPDETVQICDGGDNDDLVCADASECPGGTCIVTPAQNQALTPSCTASDGSGAAAPGRRIVETMEGLAASNTGVGTVVESICADDYAPALNAIVDRIAAALRQLCLPRPLNRNSIDMVGCEVREVQPEGRTCAEAASRGREAVPVSTEDGREVCRITQLPSDPAAGVPTGLGWFYDDFTPETVSACTFNPEQQRVSFTEDAAPIEGARIRFECLQAAPPTTEDVGWPCDDADAGDEICNPREENCDLANETLAECETRILKERYDRDNLKLTCDGDTNTCQLTCQSNVECPGGFACFDASGDGKSYCVNPTCNLN